MIEQQQVAPSDDLNELSRLWPADDDPDQLMQYFLDERKKRQDAMKLEVEKESVEEPQQSIAYIPRTPLGKKLLALRQQIIAEGLPLLNREEIEKEVADRRGGYQQAL